MKELHRIVSSRNDIEWIKNNLPMPTVADAATALGIGIEHIGKTVVLKTAQNEFVALVLRGDDRIDQNKVSKFLHTKKVSFASPQDSERATGYVAGGICPVGLPLRLLVDKRVLMLGMIFCGGGTPDSLIKLSPKVILEVSEPLVGDFAKSSMIAV
jgi:Cys-tRNA(Pro)/Cys-tRNA(Cys) deacylase